MLGVTSGTRGEFRKAALDSPVPVQEGDLATVVGNQLVITRGGFVVATRAIIGPHESVPLGADSVESLNHVLYFWRPPVSGVSAVMKTPRVNATTGAVTFPWSDGNENDFASREQAMAETAYIDTDNTLAKHFLIRQAILNDPGNSDLTSMVGVVCAIDCNATQPVTIGRP